ncbi:cohesin domain-containing protein [Methylomonas sp. CM2]|uniref:cohesin domain-containing protein n=1 Tax=Methylomonas sp. CM2 TaxID=3417647 RepID=UPI003CF857E4
MTIELPGNTDLYTAEVGSFFDANIYVDGLADFGGFDFNLTYNSANLSAELLTSASIFGADTETFANSISTVGGGKIHFAEAISATSTLEAGLNITAPTLLGTVKFKALNAALNNPLNITNPIVYSFDGTSLAGSLRGANVTIIPAQDPAPVPVPAAAFLFAPGLLAIFGRRNRNTIVKG